MTRKPSFYYTGFIVVVFLILPIGALAQITIASSDILALIGKSQIVEDDTSGNNITVNIGTAGANRTWDFRGLTLQTDKFTNQFVTPTGTPFAARVPQSNFVQKFTISSQPNATGYLYSQVSSTQFRSLGSGFVNPSGSFFFFANPQDVVPLPVQFNSTWTSVETDTFGNIQTGANIVTSTSSNAVDAWGIVRLSIGDFDCLRIRDNNTTILKFVVGGTTISSDTSKTIDYVWVSKTDLVVAEVSSQDGETNPNYTTAAGFSRLFSKTTSVASPRANENVPTDFALSQNFPNPFNPETEISFQIGRAERAELAVYNIAGEKIRTLVSGIVQPGNHSVKWDGKDETGKFLASGTYVYRLKTGNLQASRKMILLQ